MRARWSWLGTLVVACLTGCLRESELPEGNWTYYPQDVQFDTIVDLWSLEPRAQPSAAEIIASRLSPSLNGSALSLIRGLLTFEAERRLGSVGGASQVMVHPFFRPIDWERLVRLELPPPFPLLAHAATSKMA